MGLDALRVPGKKGGCSLLERRGSTCKARLQGGKLFPSAAANWLIIRLLERIKKGETEWREGFREGWRGKGREKK